MLFGVRFIGQQNVLKKRSVNGVKIGVKRASKIALKIETIQH